MGLSNEERFQKMLWSVKRLTSIVYDWKKDYRLEKYDFEGSYANVIGLVDELWHALLGKQSNGLHWFMGSASSNDITDSSSTSPWDIAIMHFLEPVGRKLGDSSVGYLELDDENGPFNALRHTDIPSLLSHGMFRGVSNSYTFKIYQWTEDIIYSLRRYDDDFRQKFIELDRISSKLMGECFAIFSQNEDFAKAYLIYQIMEMVYGPKYPYDKEPDAVTKILVNENLHHDYPSLMRWKLEDIAKIHVNLIKKEKSLESRLMAVMECCGNKMREYAHVKEKVLNIVKESPVKNCLPQVEAILNKEFEKKKESSYKPDPFAAYGFASWDLTEKPPKIDLVNNKKKLKKKKK